MSRFVKTMVALLAITAIAAPAMAATFVVHGDLNNRFNLYSNHSELYSGAGGLEQGVADTKLIGQETTNTTWGDIKYRLWTEAATNDGKVKGVYAIELGAIRFGDSNKGGAYSGDGKNIETRWAYTQFQLPNVESKAQVRIGLMPFKINSFVWNETAMGVAYTTDSYELAWMRGNEIFNSTAGDNNNSGDAFSARFNLKPAEDVKLGLFAVYQTQDGKTASTIDAGKWEIKKFKDTSYDIYTIGVDGGTTVGDIFVNWDAIYQTGEFNNVAFASIDGTTANDDIDLSAFLLHADVGINLGKNRLTYTTWYASGDDDDNDDNFDAFVSTDVDRFESIVLFEGGYTDDNYGTERPYLLNKGMFLNKLAFDQQTSSKLKWGGSMLYMMTAEDITYTDDNGKAQANSDIGLEFDAYISYKLYENVELALNGGYLFVGDAMDTFEIDRDGSADEDIYRITSRLRYKF